MLVKEGPGPINNALGKYYYIIWTIADQFFDR